MEMTLEGINKQIEEYKNLIAELEEEKRERQNTIKIGHYYKYDIIDEMLYFYCNNIDKDSPCIVARGQSIRYNDEDFVFDTNDYITLSYEDQLECVEITKDEFIKKATELFNFYIK